MGLGRIAVWVSVLSWQAIGVAQAPPSEPGDPTAASLYRMLAAEHYDALEDECDRLAARGRADGRFQSELQLASGYLIAFPGISRGNSALIRWCVSATSNALVSRFHVTRTCRWLPQSR